MKIDIRAELAVFPWKRARWTEDRLIAASPFRYDNTPSFYVFLTDTPTARAGDWGDSGAIDPEYRRGGFVKLLSFLRQETTEETLEYLRWKYGETGATELPSLALNLRIERNKRPLDPVILDRYAHRHPYLGERGISESVQRLMHVGYCRESNAVTIPWFTPDGRLWNVKFRKVGQKAFWYTEGGLPIREMVYGMNVIYRKRIDRAVIVEAEIDAMTAMSAGIPAIAVGGASFNETKRDIIAKSPIKTLIVATDNDEAGERLREQIKRMMCGYCELYDARIPGPHKDLNDVGDLDKIKDIVKNATKADTMKINLTWKK